MYAFEEWLRQQASSTAHFVELVFLIWIFVESRNLSLGLLIELHLGVNIGENIIGLFYLYLFLIIVFVIFLAQRLRKDVLVWLKNIFFLCFSVEVDSHKVFGKFLTTFREWFIEPSDHVITVA